LGIASGLAVSKNKHKYSQYSFNFDTKALMRTINGSVPNTPSSVTSQAYSPSVPLSVYRDLAAELQAAHTMLDALTTKNQQLSQENQQLRQEIGKAVQSVMHLRHVLDSHETPSYNQVPRSSPDLRTEPTRRPKPIPNQQRVQRVKTQRQDSHIVEVSYPRTEPVFIEEQEVRYYPFNESEPKEIKSWWLIFAIFLIVLSAFGAGYLIVRPLFERHSR
jgi:hypothetical protein